MKVHGIILAAGASTRMGTPKARLVYQGRTFLDRLRDVFAAACDSVSVVTAAPEPGAVVNPQPERGMLSSLQCGLRAVDAGAYLFTPVDHPAVRPETIQAIVSAPDAPVVVPTFNGRRGHPVRISREVAAAMLAASTTARDVIRRYPALSIAVDDPGILQDIDTPDDYLSLIGGNSPSFVGKA